MIGNQDLLYNDGKPLPSNLDPFNVEDLPKLSSDFNGHIVINDENTNMSYIFDIRNGKLQSVNCGDLG